MRTSAVLFDLDGTLIHTRIDFARMKREILECVAAHGLDPELYRSKDILAILEAAAPHVFQREAFLALAEEKLVAIELASCEGAEEAEGAAETMRWLLERGVRVGIVTRNCRPAVELLLARIPLPHEVLLTRADTPRVKPDPIHLELALRRLEARADESIMVGDHLMDLMGGKAAGMRTVGVLSPERPPDFFAPAAPDHVIRALPVLRRII